MSRNIREQDPSDVLRSLAAALAPHLLGPLGLDNRESGVDWLDVAAYLPTCKRALYRACRTAALPGHRVKRVWLVRRADLDAWVEAHEGGTKPPPPEPRPVPPPRALTPAEEHEREMDEVLRGSGLRRATDAERAARGLPPYDVNVAYAEHLAAEKLRKEEQAAKERDDVDPDVAAERAAAMAEADRHRLRRASKGPRACCDRCGRELAQRRDGTPISHACPHRYGYACRNADGNSEYDGTTACPWCAKRLAEP